MQFLSDLYVRCAECEGRRFQPHVLKVKLHGKSIHDLLELTVSEAIDWFAQIGEREKLSDPLEVLEEVGLGYLRLGQPLNTLSGGESQRLKLVSHLADKSVTPAKKNDAAGTAASTEKTSAICLFSTNQPPDCISMMSRFCCNCFSGWSTPGIRWL